MRIAQIVTVTALAAAGIAVASGTSSADRGVINCISYSWEPGNVSTTVYLHNRCDTREELTVHPANPSAACGDWTTTLGPDEKTSEVFVCEPGSISA